MCFFRPLLLSSNNSLGAEKGFITEGISPLQESRISKISRFSGQTRLCFSHSGETLESLELNIGALRKGPPVHGSRSSREINIHNASCQMGGREVAR